MGRHERCMPVVYHKNHATRILKANILLVLKGNKNVQLPVATLYSCDCNNSVVWRYFQQCSMYLLLEQCFRKYKYAAVKRAYQVHFSDIAVASKSFTFPIESERRHSSQGLYESWNCCITSTRVQGTLSLCHNCAIITLIWNYN